MIGSSLFRTTIILVCIYFLCFRIAALYVHRRLNENIPTAVLQEILNVCLNHIGSGSILSNYETFHVLDIILKIIVTVNDRQTVLVCDTNRVTQMSLDFSSSKFGARCKALSLPIIAGLTMFSCTSLDPAVLLHCKGNQQSTSEKMFDTLHRYSLPDNDEDYRFAAATALRFIGTVVQQCSSFSLSQSDAEDNIILRTTPLILHTAIRLLQDESSRVRDEASKFVTYLFQKVPRTLNSLECLEILFTYEFLIPFMGSKQNVVRFLWKFLSLEDLILSSSKDSEIENPFDHGSKNIFSEEIWIVEKVVRSLTTIFDRNMAKETFSSTMNELINASLLQRTVTKLETLNQCKSDKIGNKLVVDIQASFTNNFGITIVFSFTGSVRESWLATALCLQMRKINFTLQLLSKVIEPEEMAGLNIPKMCNISNFTFYF